MNQAGINTFFKDHCARLRNMIERYVGLQSPTSEPDRVDELASVIENDLSAIGARVQTFEGSPRPVVADFGSDHPDLLLIFHHDTVWPVDSFQRSGIEGDRWYGPGIFDMKANIPVGILVMDYLRSYKPELARRVRLISSPDEETLGAVSRTVLPGLAEGAEWALVFEPPKSDGSFKYRRKGVGRLNLKFVGLATHAGNHYTAGRSALKAAARFLLAAEDRSRPDEGFTVNVGILRGGSAANTRPGFASMVLDIRMENAAGWEPFLAFARAYRDPDKVEIQEVEHSLLPPLHVSHEGLEVLRQVCADLGQPYALGAAGGGSDGSHLAGLGIKVLDGLGVSGAGEHAENEHILISALEAGFKRSLLLTERLLSNR